MGQLDWSNIGLANTDLYMKLINETYDESYVALFLDHNKLTIVPRVLDLPQFSEVTVASFSYNHIVNDPSFQQSAFLWNIAVLNLSQNDLIEVPNLRRCLYLKHLDLSCNKIAHVKENYLPPYVKVFNLSQNDLKEVPNFRKCICLKHVDLSWNKITHAKENYLPPHVKLFNLCRNNLEAIPNFSRCKRLLNLIVSQNKIADCSTLLPKKLTSLELQSNRLDTLPHLQNCVNFRRLDISNNSITNIEASYLPWRVKVLNCHHNKLKEIPNFVNHSYLQEVDVSFNDIEDVKNAQFLPRSLSSLKLMQNKIRSLPDLRSLQLKELDVDKNEICEMDGDSLPQTLKIFSISNNNLQVIPNMSELKEVEKLYLSQNRISKLEVQSLPPHLTVLSLDYNNIREVPDTISQLKSLVDLDLRYNQIYKIAHIPPDLTDLNLANNCLGSAPALSHIKHSKLKLDLSVNHISEISGNDLPAHIKSLDLNHNNLVTLAALTSIEKLDVSENRIKNVESFDIRQELHLFDNPIEEIGRDCFNSEELYQVFVDGVDMSQVECFRKPPPEVFLSGHKSLMQYYEQMEREHDFDTSRNRLFLIGPPESGKTSLLDTISSGEPSLTEASDRTKVVEIKTLKITGDTAYTVFDQGGHPIYSVVNELFLSQNGVVFVTEDIMKMHRESINMEFQKALYQHPGNEIHVVLTHTDLCEESDIDRRKHDCQNRIKALLDEEIITVQRLHDQPIADDLVKGYHAKKDEGQCFPVSNKDMAGIRELREFLSNLLKRRKVAVSVTWSKCYSILNSCKSDFITLAEFQQMYDNSGTEGGTVDSRTEEAATCLKYFDDVGFVIWMRHSEKLRNTIFKNFDFIVRTLKAILHHDIAKFMLYENVKGHMNKTEYSNAVSKYEHEGLITSQFLNVLLKHQDLIENDILICIDLLQERYICHDISVDQRYRKVQKILYFPWLISNKSKPDDIDYSMCITERFMSVKMECIFLNSVPPNICEKMCVCIQKYAYLNHYLGERCAWSDGFCAHIAGVQCYVYKESKQIDLLLKGDVENLDYLWQLFAIFFEKFKEFLDNWSRLVENLHIICSHCVHKKIRTPHQWLPEEVFPNSRFPRQMRTLQCPEDKGSNIPEAMVVCITENVQNQREAITDVKDYLKEAHVYDFKGSGELKCERTEASVNLEWEWRKFPVGQGLAGTLIRYRMHRENSWTSISLAQRNIRRHEIQDIHKDKHYVFQVGPVCREQDEPDFFLTRGCHAVSDNSVTEEHMKELEKWHSSLKGMKHVQYILDELKSTTVIGRRNSEILLRVMREKGPGTVAYDILENYIYRATSYHSLYVFWHILRNLDQPELAKHVPVLLVTGELLNDLPDISNDGMDVP